MVEELRLARILQLADPDVDWTSDVLALKEIGILDERKLLFSDFGLSVVSKIPASRLARIKDAVSSLIVTPGRTGEEVYDEQARHAREYAASGVEALDQLLDGGWTAGEVVEIAGTKESGKTLLAMHSMIRNLISSPSAKAHWIDTTGDFSAQRALAVAEALSKGKSQQNAPVTSTSVLNRVEVSRAFNLEAASERLGAIVQSGDEALPRILIVDSVTHLFENLLGGNSAQGSAAMVTFVRRLSALAKSLAGHPMTVLVRDFLISPSERSSSVQTRS